MLLGMIDKSSVGDAPYQNLSNPAFLLIVAAAFSVWFFFDYKGQDGRAMIGALSVCAVLGVGTILGRHIDVFRSGLRWRASRGRTAYSFYSSTGRESSMARESSLLRL